MVSSRCNVSQKFKTVFEMVNIQAVNYFLYHTKICKVCENISKSWLYFTSKLIKIISKRLFVLAKYDNHKLARKWSKMTKWYSRIFLRICLFDFCVTCIHNCGWATIIIHYLFQFTGINSKFQIRSPSHVWFSDLLPVSYLYPEDDRK